jgi:hypothetical protein
MNNLEKNYKVQLISMYVRCFYDYVHKYKIYFNAINGILICGF